MCVSINHRVRKREQFYILTEYAAIHLFFHSGLDAISNQKERERERKYDNAFHKRKSLPSDPVSSREGSIFLQTELIDTDRQNDEQNDLFLSNVAHIVKNILVLTW